MKHIFLLPFICLIGLWAGAQSGVGYDPENPGDPNVQYILRMEASPANAGNVSPKGMSKVEPGETVYCRANAKPGYRFVQWMSGENVLSTQDYLDFTMPDHNETLTARFEYTGYDPENPGDPAADGYRHYVRIYASPAQGGSFNSSTFLLTEGKTQQVYAWPATGYKFEAWQSKGVIVSRDNPMTVRMGDSDLEYTALFAYNPTSPVDPSANSFNAATGELIIDNFAPDELYSAISATIGDISNAETVKSLTVIGQITPYSLGIISYLTKCVTIDLSRTTGYAAVPSYMFDNENSLQTLYLPMSVESIGTNAFGGCTAIKDIYLYATTPPALDEDALAGINPNVTIHVPSTAVHLYATAAGWKNLHVKSLDDKEKSVTIAFPQDSDMTRYANLTLELTNIQSNQSYRCIVTNRDRYTFFGLMEESFYKAVLKNAAGEILSEIIDIHIVSDDVTATLPRPKELVGTTLHILTPGGEDVTARCTITWLDAQGNYLRQGNAIADIPEGTSLQFTMTPDKELATDYEQPAPQTISLTAENATTTFTLSPFELHTLNGSVKNKNTGLGIGDANVTITQLVNGKHTKIFTTKTDSKGRFSTQAYNAPTTIAVSSYNFVNESVTAESLDFTDGQASLPAITLTPIIGTTINLSYTYQLATYPGQQPEIRNWIESTSNLVYKLENLTSGNEIRQISVRHPKLVILEDVEAGDNLRLTVSSKTEAFPPVECEFTVPQSKEADICVPIVEYGSVKASFASSDNKVTNGWLYDAAGRCVAQLTFDADKSLSQKLSDGDYTLIAIGSSQRFGAISNLARLPQTMFQPDADYLQAELTIRQGEYSVVQLDHIPAFNEDRLIYLGDCRFNAGTSDVTAGNFLTLSGKVEFTPLAENNIENTRMIIDLPESLTFVENSVKIGDTMCDSYTLDGQLLAIPITDIANPKTIKFCVVPTEKGENSITSFVEFTSKGRKTIAPMGNALFNVKEMAINAPTITASGRIKVSGSLAAKTDKVNIYDGSVLIGSASPGANGSWMAETTLNNPYNLSKHQIHAESVLPNGQSIVSETKETLVDRNAIFAKSVTMTHYNGWRRANLDVVFNLVDGTTNPPHFDFYHAADFTFAIDLSDNNPGKVSDVFLYVFTTDNRILKCTAKYDETSGKWIAKHKFGSYSLPTNVSVDFYCIKNPQLDRDYLNTHENMRADMKEGLEADNAIFDETMTQVENLLATDDPDHREIDRLLASVHDSDVALSTENRAMLSRMTYEEWDAYITAKVEESVSQPDETTCEIEEFMRQFDMATSSISDADGNYTMEYGDCSGYVQSEMIAQGFLPFSTTDNTNVFIKSEEGKSVFVDFGSNVSITLTITETGARMMKANGMSDIQTMVGNIMGGINNLTGIIGMALDAWDLRIARQAQVVEDLLFDKLMINAAIDGMPWWEADGIENLLKESQRLNKLTLREQAALDALRRFEQIGDVLKKIGNVVSVISTIFDGYQMIADLTDWERVIASLNPPCDAVKEQVQAISHDARGYANRVMGGYAVVLTADLIGITTMIPSVSAAIATGGMGLPVLLVNIGATAASIAASHFLIEQSDGWKNEVRTRLNSLSSQCKEKEDDDDDGDDSQDDDSSDSEEVQPNQRDNVPDPTTKPSTPIMDPSGYVYEGVAANRLEGVTATCFHKEEVTDMYGVVTEVAVKWDAEEYAQENPLFTDEEGKYAWDVPQGMWQVKFEKEGYETAYSEWLPVPPPQLDVNIGMTQARQPEVKTVHAYPDGVVVEFDKYMLPSTLNPDNIIVTENGAPVEGEVVMLNEEAAYGDDAPRYASKVRFKASKPFSGGEVTLTVANRVTSYAGVRMQDTFTQSFDIEPEITAINATEEIIVPYGEATMVNLSVLPAEAAAGKRVRVWSSSEMIATADREECVLDANGRGEIMVSGLLPGSTAMHYAIDGYDVEGTTLISVKALATDEVAAPYASIASGSEIAPGTEIYLYCPTDGAGIRYTLDGGCPCDNTPSVLTYDPSRPIIATTGSIRIKAQAHKDGLADSEVATIEYTVTSSGIDTVATEETGIVPTRTHDVFTIRSGSEAVKRMEIINMSGAVVMTATDLTANPTINVAHMPGGVYLVTYTIGDSRRTQRLIKI